MKADIAAVNLDPRMHDPHLLHLRRRQIEMGDLLAVVDPCSGGAYGHKRYISQPVAEAPKADATEAFKKSNRLNSGEK